MKYTKEKLSPVVCESKSFAEVIRKLGLRQCGGTQSNISRRVKLYGLDTSHFLGQRRGRIRKQLLHWSQILVRDRSLKRGREHAALLRRAMLEAGFVHRCERCGCLPEWQGKPLVLQIDHIDGDTLNNEPDNVRFICPNCHSQTPNFGSKNRNRLTEEGIDDLYAWTGDDVN
jgi:hypothetical protein